MSLTKVSYSMIQGAPLNLSDFGAVPGGYIDDALDAAVLAVNDGGTIVIDNKTSQPYKIGRVHVLTKYVNFVGNGAAATYVGGAYSYNSMVSIVVDDGVTAFLMGRDANIPNTPQAPYLGGMLTFDGIQIRPVTARSAGSCFVRYNTQQTLRVRNCIIRGFEAGLDLTGCYGCDIYNNYFTENKRGINGDPDYTNATQDPDGSILIGWENNDWRIYNNVFANGTEAHIFTNMFGHGISVYSNGFENCPVGVKVSGYDGTKAFLVPVMYGFSEYDNYYENILQCVILGSTNDDSFVNGASVGDSYINAGNSGNYPYLTIKACSGLTYRSGSFFMPAIYETTYKELIIVAGVLQALVASDVRLKYAYDGVFFPTFATQQDVFRIEYKFQPLNPCILYVDGNSPNAISYTAVNPDGNYPITAFDMGAATKPFEDLESLDFWLNRTPMGLNVKRKASAIQINLSGSTFAGTIDGKGILGRVVVKTINTSDVASSFVNKAIFANFQDLLFDDCLFQKTDFGTADFTGRLFVINSKMTMENTSFAMTGGSAGLGSTWLCIKSTPLTFESPIFISTAGGRNYYFVKLLNGATVYTTTDVAAGDTVGANYLIEAGNSATIV